MTISFDFGQVPWFVWVICGVVFWYALAGAVISSWWKIPKSVEPCDDYSQRACLWVFSPVVAAVLAVVTPVWLSLFALSFGIIPPPWFCRRGDR